MTLVATAAIFVAGARSAAGFGEGLAGGDGVGGVVGEGERGGAAVISTSLILSIAALLPPIVPAALPFLFPPPPHGPND